MREKTLLQGAVAIGGIVPVAAGLAGVVLAGGITGDHPSAALASHLRYLSGLLLAIGLAFWSCIPGIETKSARFRLLTLLVVTGGFGRLLGVALAGVPPAPMLGGLGMELVVTPVLCLWQSRVAGRAARHEGPGI